MHHFNSFPCISVKKPHLTGQTPLGLFRRLKELWKLNGWTVSLNETGRDISPEENKYGIYWFQFYLNMPPFQKIGFFHLMFVLCKSSGYSSKGKFLWFYIKDCMLIKKKKCCVFRSISNPKKNKDLYHALDIDYEMFFSSTVISFRNLFIKMR